MSKAWLVKTTISLFILILPCPAGGIGPGTFIQSTAIEVSGHLNPDPELKNGYSVADLNDTSGIQTMVKEPENSFLTIYDQENMILRTEKEKAEKKLRMVSVLAMVLMLILISVLGFYIFQLNRKFKILKEAAALEKNRFRILIEAQEMDWKRIAGDLHDSVGQLLSLSKLHLSEVIDSSEVQNPEHELMLNRTAQIIDEACQEVRNISHNLMPGPLIRLGLVSAIKELVRKINSTRKVKVEFSSNLSEIRFNEKIEISVYRIIQEIFSNIMKHSCASEVEISLNILENQRLNLSIKDNGVGFDTEEIEKSDGIGWKNIYSRLAIINGTMNINSEKNHGTNIEINIVL